MGKFGGGNGTTSAPYLVEDEEDLRMVGKNLTRHFKQVKDIVVTGDLWEGIGSGMTPFTGSYDGMGYSITGLRFRFTPEVFTMHAKNKNLLPRTTQYSYDAGHTGLFNYVEAPGVLKNIKTEVYVSFVFDPTITCPSTDYFRDISVSGIVGKYDAKSPLENCHCDILVDAELFRKNSSYSVHNFYISGIAALCYSSINCSTNMVVNHTATVNISNMTNQLIVHPHSISTSTLRNSISYTVTNFKCSVKLNQKLGKDDFSKTDYISAVAWQPSGQKFLDSEFKGIIFRTETINGVKLNAYCRDSVLFGKSTRTSVIDSVFDLAITIDYMFSTFYENATDCRLINCTIKVLGFYKTRYVTFYGITRYTSERCLIKDSTLEGLTSNVSVAGMSSDAKDCSLVNTKVISQGTVGGVVIDGYALRCVFSGGYVEGKGTYLGGILTSSSSYHTAKNCFFLGEYVKGVGAITVQAGLISALASPNNLDNYSLDTARLILE